MDFMRFENTIFVMIFFPALDIYKYKNCNYQQSAYIHTLSMAFKFLLSTRHEMDLTIK